jgi:hypothetical protein
MHNRTHAYYERRVRAGLERCPYCGEVVRHPWDLAHSDDRQTYIGASCARCNRREAGLKTARLRRGQTTVTSQVW